MVMRERLSLSPPMYIHMLYSLFPLMKIAKKRREAKGKREKERYIHLNAEFQRIARGEKKAFLSDQCKKIEENSRIGKTRNLFKEVRDSKGTLPMQRWAQ